MNKATTDLHYVLTAHLLESHLFTSISVKIEIPCVTELWLFNLCQSDNHDLAEAIPAILRLTAT